VTVFTDGVLHLCTCGSVCVAELSVANIMWVNEWMNEWVWSVTEVLLTGQIEVQAGVVWHSFFLRDFALAQHENLHHFLNLLDNIWGLFDRASSSSWDKVKCQLDATIARVVAPMYDTLCFCNAVGKRYELADARLWGYTNRG